MSSVSPKGYRQEQEQVKQNYTACENQRNRSITLLGDLPVHSGYSNDYKSPVAQMVQLTGGTDMQLFAPISKCFLSRGHIVLCRWFFASFSVTPSGNLRSLQSAEVAKVVQLLQAGTSISALPRFALSADTLWEAQGRYQETRWSAGHHRSRSILQLDLLHLSQGGAEGALPEP